jgi:hypothetical protein
MESIYENGGFIGPTLSFSDTDFYQVETTIPPGEEEYTTPGTYSWTAPAGVTSVSVVCVGAGGGPAANTSGASGAGGGGLGYKNNIAVTPGASYTVVVGAGGTRVTSGTAPAGGESYFINTSTVRGGGGAGGIAATNGTRAGGTFTGDGGGNGGAGGSRNSSTTAAGGGGGAGGYSGNGGAGGTALSGNGGAGAGGGGGGGGGGGSADSAGSGGGVGIYGAGSNGAGGARTTADGRGGFGGSGGANATFASTATTAQNIYGTGTPSTPGIYGGGGCGADTTINEQSPGAGGAVRIIWGGSRSFPSTNTANGEGTSFTALIDADNRKNSGIWNLKAVFNNIFFPESGLSLTRTETAFTTFTAYSSTERAQDVVFACDITFPSPGSDGLLFKMGGATFGCWVGLRDSGTVFRVRAGEGVSLSASSATTPVLDITDFPQDGNTHTVVWEFRVAVGRVRLWIDGKFKGEAFTTAGGSLAGVDAWAGTADGSYMASGSQIVNEPTGAWQGTNIGTGLRVYTNQLVTA